MSFNARMRLPLGLAIGFTLVSMSPMAVSSLSAEDKSSCSVDETWGECLHRLRQEAATATEKVVGEERAKATRTVAEEAEDGLSSAVAVGAAGSKRTFLPLLMAGLGFDGIGDGDGKLTFTINPKPWAWGRLSGELVADEAGIFSKLSDQIPEDERGPRLASLKDELGDFDDLSLSLRLVFRGKSNGLLGRTLSDYDREFGLVLYEEMTSEIVGYQMKALESTRELTDLPCALESKAAPGRPNYDVCNYMVVSHAPSTVEFSEAIQRTLKQNNFFALAKLANNQPQLYLTASWRERGDLVGPDEWHLGITYELGLGANLNKLRREARKHGVGLTEYVDFYRHFVEENENALESQSRFKFEASYGETAEYESPVSDIELSLPKVNRLSVAIAYGRILRHGRAGKEASRFDVEAKFEDVTEDENLQDRFVATATFTERLTDDLVFSLSAVWANKPEYRGDVDAELSARAGLRYKIGSNPD